MARPKNPESRPFAVPQKPQDLSARASKEWDRLIKELQDSGLQITVAHRAVVALAATIAADIVEAWAELDAGKHTYMATGKGTVELHPAAKRMDALRRDYLKALSVIGLRPGTSTELEDGESLEEVLNG
jgi:phage terminase small subunit